MAESIPALFQKTVEKFPHKPALAKKIKSENRYADTSYTDLAEQVKLCAMGLLALGVKKGDKLAILSNNRPEWAIADLAMLHIGAVNVPIYYTLLPEQVKYVLETTGVSIAFAGDKTSFDKIMKVKDQLPALKILAAFDEFDLPKNDAKMEYRKFAEIAELGQKSGARDAFDTAWRALKSSDLATIVFTSGTTQNPKGVMLTHGNIAANVEGVTSALYIDEYDTFLSILPLCHVFERTCGYYSPLARGTRIAYAESFESIKDDMLIACPTVVLAVPRLYEKMRSRMMKKIASETGFKKKLIDWSASVGLEVAQVRHAGQPMSISLKIRYAVADKLVFSKVRAQMGGKIRFMVSGGAALVSEISTFFHSIGINLIEGYGLSETSPVITFNRLDWSRPGTVGQKLENLEVMVAPDGELLARGPSVMQGYFGDEAATEAVIDHEKWFHTGDIASIDSEGFVKITDRKKDVIVMSNGKNVAPQPIENKLVIDDFISQAVVVGSERKYIAVLIVPDFQALKIWAGNENVPSEPVDELIAHPRVQELFKSRIAHMSRDLAPYERVKKFRLLKRELSMDEGELTHTMKIKRRVVNDKYADLIESMYDD